jgi:hypothetical protein
MFLVSQPMFVEFDLQFERFEQLLQHLFEQLVEQYRRRLLKNHIIGGNIKFISNNNLHIGQVLKYNVSL